jgi:hypothetical protein
MLTALSRRFIAVARGRDVLRAADGRNHTDVGPYSAQPASADVCDEIIIVEPDGQGIYSRPARSSAARARASPGAAGGLDLLVLDRLDGSTWLTELGGSLPGDPLPWLDVYVWYEQICRP